MQAQEQVAALGREPVLREPALKSAESFICSLYTSRTGKRFTSADEARHYLFCQKSKKSEDLPPTSESLEHHLQRANFQVYIWKLALAPMQNLPPPIGHGWFLEEDKLVPVLMQKSCAPKGMLELTVCHCRRSACTRNCSCKLNRLPCTEACSCMSDDDSCDNPFNNDSISCESSDSDDGV